MKKITIEQLIAKFKSGVVNGSTFIGIDTATIPILKGGQKNDMQGRVTKLSTGNNVMVFQNKNVNAYQKMVERRLLSEGKTPIFELKPRKWGERIKGTPLIEHKGQFYLEVIFLKPGSVTYLLDGKPIRKELITGLDTNKKEGEQAGLENKVIIRTFKMLSIARITLNKETFIVEN